MKISNITKVVVAVVALMTSACNNVDDIITSMKYSRNFTPTSFEASVVENLKASFTWETNATPGSYVIELYTGSEIDQANLAATYNVDNTYGSGDNPYITEDLLPLTEYTARIKAIGNNRDDSNWGILTETFTTKKEEEVEPEPVEVTETLEFTAGAAVPASFTLGCLTFNILDTDGKFAIDANTSYFGTSSDYYKYTARMKTGAKSSTKSGITIVSTGTGKLVMAFRTGSNSADRAVIITKDGAEIASFMATEKNAETGVAIEGEAEPKNVYFYNEFEFTPGTYELTYPDGSVNFYGFQVTYLETGDSPEPAEPTGPEATEGSVNFGEAAASVNDGQQFTFGSANIVVNNGNEKFTIDANTQYFGDATAQTKYVTRMKSGGASGTSNGVTLTVEAKGTVTIAMRSSSSSADRAVEIVDATGTSKQKWTVGDSNATSNVTIDGEAEPKKVFNYYSIELEEGIYNITYDGGLNFYGLSYKPSK